MSGKGGWGVRVWDQGLEGGYRGGALRLRPTPSNCTTSTNPFLAPNLQLIYLNQTSLGEGLVFFIG